MSAAPPVLHLSSVSKAYQSPGGSTIVLAGANHMEYTRILLSELRTNSHTFSNLVQSAISTSTGVPKQIDHLSEVAKSAETGVPKLLGQLDQQRLKLEAFNEDAIKNRGSTRDTGPGLLPLDERKIEKSTDALRLELPKPTVTPATVEKQTNAPSILKSPNGGKLK